MCPFPSILCWLINVNVYLVYSISQDYRLSLLLSLTALFGKRKYQFQQPLYCELTSRFFLFAACLLSFCICNVRADIKEKDMVIRCQFRCNLCLLIFLCCVTSHHLFYLYTLESKYNGTRFLKKLKINICGKYTIRVN